MTDTKGQTTKNGKISIVLAASLAINAGLIGIVGGQLLADRDEKSNSGFVDRKIAQNSHILSAFDTLEPKDQRLLKRTMLSHWRDTHNERKQRRTNFEEIVENIGAEPFNREVVEADLREFLRLDAELKVQAIIGLLDVMEEMPPEARVALADSILLRKPKFKPKKVGGPLGAHYRKHDEDGLQQRPHRPPAQLLEQEDEQSED